MKLLTQHPLGERASYDLELALDFLCEMDQNQNSCIHTDSDKGFRYGHKFKHSWVVAIVHLVESFIYND